MKLRNKILTFAAPAAIIATTAPIVLTSCGNKTEQIYIHNKEATYSLESGQIHPFIFYFDNSHQFKLADKDLYGMEFTFNNVKINNLPTTGEILDKDEANFVGEGTQGTTAIGCEVTLDVDYGSIKATDKITFDVVAQLWHKESASAEMKEFSNKITITEFTITIAA